MDSVKGRAGLSVLVVARHPGTIDQFLVLFVVPRTNQKDVVRIRHDEILKPPEDYELFLVLGQDDVPAAFLQDVFLCIRDVAVRVLLADI